MESTSKSFSLLFVLILVISSLIIAKPALAQTPTPLTSVPNLNGLVAYWKLDEGNGNIVLDSSGNNYQGTIQGASWINNQGKNYLYFNGASDYVNLPSMDLTNIDSLTVVAWINSNLSQVGVIVYHGDLGEFMMGNGYLGPASPFLNINQTYATFKVKLTDGNWYSIQSSSQMTPNAWHQVVGVWVEGVSLKVYIDGVLAGENDSMPDLSLYNPGPSFPSSLGIYSQNQWNSPAFFEGLMSNVMIFNTALSPQEISALYAAPTLATPTLTTFCTSSVSSSSLNVNINGYLTYNGSGISDAPILLSYSVTGGESWQDLTLVNTASDGSYSALWFPSATGDYMLKAVYQGNENYLGTSNIVNFSMVAPSADQSAFSVTSNSTLSALFFNSTSYELSFTVSGPPGTTGYVNVYIPNSLVNNTSDLKVNLDGNPIEYTIQAQNDGWLLYFTYNLCTRTVMINLGSSRTKSLTISPTITAAQTPTSGLSWMQIAILAFMGVILVIVAVIAVVFLNKKKPA